MWSGRYVNRYSQRRPAGCDVLRLMHEPPDRDTPERYYQHFHSVHAPPAISTYGMLTFVRGDWTKLPPDLAAEIGGRRLRFDLTEYTHFRAVCKPWRQATDDPRVLHSRFLPRDWVVLRNHNFFEETRCHHLLNVATGASIVGVALPELSGHRPLGYAEGLLVLRNTTSSGIRLLNPLTRAVTDLPDISSVLANASNDALDSAYFSWGFGVIDGGSAAAAAASPATVVLLLREVPLLGDTRWAPVDASELAGGAAKVTFQSVLSLHGRFYVSTSMGDVLTVELHPEPRLVYVIRQATTLPATSSYILAPSSNDAAAGMIMVRASMSDERCFPPSLPTQPAVYFCIGQGPLFYVFHNDNWRGEPALEMESFDWSEASFFGPTNLDVSLACCADFLPGTM
ncbi:hypothetical protein SETIT_1G247200v2 [Setaria italica]|uniref:KIB1-4 beta-propeller domain-containing protein n=2 Tax=Setaria italica TaxID=4555 RepID=A0A368PNV6_SETIT|nr:hypothetical protein SETIT_1G247200v2 [Setaria italica]